MKRLLIVSAVAGAALLAGKMLEEAAKKANDPERAAYEARFQKMTCDIQDFGGPIPDSAETTTETN